MKTASFFLLFTAFMASAPAMAGSSNWSVLQKRACKMFENGSTYGEVFQSVRGALEADADSARVRDKNDEVIRQYDFLQEADDAIAQHHRKVAAMIIQLGVTLDCPQFQPLLPKDSPKNP